MPKHDPLPDWSGEDVFIIGGGPSLRRFRFAQLNGKNTIGCNHAFLLGAEACNIAAFGDFNFFKQYLAPLAAYKGWVVTNCRIGGQKNYSWLRYIPRLENGLSPTLARLGWNQNTGALAVNLALALGAARVFLLGFDMSAVPPEDGEGKRTHWHDTPMQDQRDEHYEKFRRGFDRVARDLPVHFPGREVLNVTDGSSKLTAFPFCSFEDAGLVAPEFVVQPVGVPCG